MINIAFSWDDGAVEDIKLMDLSVKYNIPGIFFIPATNKERKVMAREEIKELFNNNFEIGAHTYSHAYLTYLPFESVDAELKNGKSYLEQLLGIEVPHFCFPGGKYNSQIIEASQKYFTSARTSDTGALSKDYSFLIKPTFHYYDRGIKSLIFNSMKNQSPIFKLSLKNLFHLDYFNLLKAIISDLELSSESYRIIVWGHSWEIEKYSLWNRLIDFYEVINLLYPDRILGYSEMINSKVKDELN